MEGEHQQAKIEAEPLARAFGFAKRLFGAALENVQFRLKFGLRRGRHSVDEKNPPEVIKFMLDGPRKQPAASECERYTFLVDSFLHPRTRAGQCPRTFQGSLSILRGRKLGAPTGVTSGLISTSGMKAATIRTVLRSAPVRRGGR